MKKSCNKGHAYLIIGSIGVLFGALYLALSFNLPFGKLDQPGAAVFPVIVGVIIIIASLATIWEGKQLLNDKQAYFPVGSDRKRLLILVLLLFSYCIAMPLTGFLISSILFGIMLMRVLSELGWRRILTYSLLMSFSLYIVFISILKVPLPRGIIHF